MIEKPKIQLSNFPFTDNNEHPNPLLIKSYLKYAFLLSFFLILLFVAIVNHDVNQLYQLAVALLIVIAFLVPMRIGFIKKNAEITLKSEDIRERINLTEAENAQEKKAIASFQEKIIDLSQLKDLTEKLSMSLYLEDTSKTLSSEVNRLFGKKDSTIILYLFHSKTGELGISSSQKGEMRVNIKNKKGDVFDQWVVRTMQPLLVEDTRRDYRFDLDKIAQEEQRPIRSVMSVPLIVGNKALGILRADSPQNNQYTTEDLRFLATIGQLVAVGIENAQLFERIEQLAIKDGLTGLYLRRYMLERMSEEVTRQLRSKSELSFLMIDLDHFKQYNDKYGHVSGDKVLKSMGRMLVESFQYPGNMICRYGGEEFCVLLPDCSKTKACELAEKFRKLVEQSPITVRREKINISVSIGVASFPLDAKGKDDLIMKADQALYDAKESGRNKVCSV